MAQTYNQLLRARRGAAARRRVDGADAQSGGDRGDLDPGSRE
ncbi:hypothetical protein AB5I41_08550 [Sphingomonas sp. MMS24-JH45]